MDGFFEQIGVNTVHGDSLLAVCCVVGVRDAVTLIGQMGDFIKRAATHAIKKRSTITTAKHATMPPRARYVFVFK